MITIDYKINNKYIYDNGLRLKYYTCINCDSNKILMIPSGGFSPPKLICEECNNKVINTPYNLSKQEYQIIKRKEKLNRILNTEEK